MVEENNKLEISDTNRQRCSVCKRCIPKKVERLNITHQGNMGITSQRRVCGLCIVDIYKKLNKRQINNWRAEMVAKAI